LGQIHVQLGAEVVHVHYLPVVVDAQLKQEYNRDSDVDDASRQGCLHNSGRAQARGRDSKFACHDRGLVFEVASEALGSEQHAEAEDIQVKDNASSDHKDVELVASCFLAPGAPQVIPSHCTYHQPH